MSPPPRQPPSAHRPHPRRSAGEPAATLARLSLRWLSDHPRLLTYAGDYNARPWRTLPASAPTQAASATVFAGWLTPAPRSIRRDGARRAFRGQLKWRRRWGPLPAALPSAI